MPKVTEINVGQGRSTLRRIQVELRIFIILEHTKSGQEVLVTTKVWVGWIRLQVTVLTSSLHSEHLTFPSCKRESEWLQCITKTRLDLFHLKQATEHVKNCDHFMTRKREEEKSPVSYLPSQLHLLLKQPVS